MLADPAGDALLAEMNHHPDMAAAVAPAAAERELGTAESVTQVMQWRLEKLRNAGRGTSGHRAVAVAAHRPRHIERVNSGTGRSPAAK